MGEPSTDFFPGGRERRAVFLDRDGVINRMVLHPEFGVVDSPANAEEMELLPGVGAAVAGLNRLGLRVIVISNQPGVAKGKFTPRLLAEMESKMRAGIEAEGGRLDAVYNCLHHPDAALPEWRVRCACRKPRPGLLEQAARDWQIDLGGSYMVGDGVADVLAGRAVGATTLLVAARKCYLCESLAEHDARPDYLVGDLAQASLVISALEEGEPQAARTFAYTCEVV
ncbi:MAG: D-glycero-D-manno-heptose 1,7-bisphosphate phosphatase [Acidobacteriota bacterium]|jgi:D-glycero-D-manno-heptose 1,7-bisphosphate phosphatase|nr:D-glycero-D-manno-heptose 1,7-bisphosphate phosphatase [Acidobacteriota bacterium]